MSPAARRLLSQLDAVTLLDADPLAADVQELVRAGCVDVHAERVDGRTVTALDITPAGRAALDAPAPTSRDLYRHHPVRLTSGREVDALCDGERIYVLKGRGPGADITAIVEGGAEYILASTQRLIAADAIPYLAGDADAVCEAAEPAPVFGRRARTARTVA